MPTTKTITKKPAVQPLPAAEVSSDERYMILAQFSTPKGIKISVKCSYWPNISNLPEVVEGEIEQWSNKVTKSLRILWTEADGSKTYDTENLDVLLKPTYDFKLLRGPRKR